MTLIDGKAIAEQVKQEIAAEVAEIVAKGGRELQTFGQLLVEVFGRTDGFKLAGQRHGGTSVKDW